MARTVPTLLTQAPGNFITAALWNSQVRDMAAFLSNPPTFVGTQVTAQNLGTTTAFVPINIDTEAIDTDGGHSTVTNTSQYVVQVAGKYRIDGVVVFPITGTGTRGARLTVNGTATTGGIPGSERLLAPAPTFATTVATSGVAQCSVGDVIQMWSLQNTGATMSTTSIGDAITSLSIQWISI